MEYISVKDTNKLIRKSLKESFPGVKFSVRGTRSTTISWVDGPTESEVSSVVNRFSGSYFDGMIDYQGSIYAELDGKPVRFLLDFIFYNHTYSDSTIQYVLDLVKEKHQIKRSLTIDDFKCGKYYNVYLVDKSIQTTILKELYKLSFIDKIHESETANSVRVVGDDNYGYSGANKDSQLNGYPK